MFKPLRIAAELTAWSGLVAAFLLVSSNHDFSHPRLDLFACLTVSTVGLSLREWIDRAQCAAMTEMPVVARTEHARGFKVMDRSWPLV
jgi:hypothetical protein